MSANNCWAYWTQNIKVNSGTVLSTTRDLVSTEISIVTFTPWLIFEIYSIILQFFLKSRMYIGRIRKQLEINIWHSYLLARVLIIGHSIKKGEQPYRRSIPPHRSTQTYGPKFSQFHAVFRKNWIKLYVGAPRWRVGAPSYGNPGSTPGKGIKPLGKSMY